MNERVEFEARIPGKLYEDFGLPDKIVHLMERFSYSVRDVFAV